MQIRKFTRPAAPVATSNMSLVLNAPLVKGRMTSRVEEGILNLNHRTASPRRARKEAPMAAPTLVVAQALAVGGKKRRLHHHQ